MCDTDACEQDERGRTQHVPGCAVHEAISRDADMQYATAMEDGYPRRRRPLALTVPAQADRRAA
jgi:hypothetical protein